MEFNEKLHQLRKRKGLTQEELAAALYVSRTAVSKWESGRGYPNIESLKAIAAFFSVTIDELLSSGEALTIAEADSRQKVESFRSRVFGLLDLSAIAFLFLPFFGEKADGAAEAVSLLKLTQMSIYVRIAYFAVVACMAASGILAFVPKNCHRALWEKIREKLSLVFNGVGILLFIISPQPYAAALLFVFFAIKVLMLTKKR